MKKLLIAALTALLITGCRAVETEGDMSAPPETAAPTHRADLLVRETIEPEEVSVSDSSAEMEMEKAEREEASVSEIEAETNQTEQKAEQAEVCDADIGTEIEEGTDGGAVNESSELAQASEDDAGGDPLPAEGGSGGTGENEILCEGANSMHLWGICTITHYCSCSQCCGAWAGGATASGTIPTVGRTVAADLPFGTRLMINGREYVVEDRGVGGMWVDIFVNGHQEALDLGMYQTEVYIIDG